MISYSVKRAKRKTVAIHIKKDATVEVRAPFFMSNAQIEHFVAHKQRWVEEHLARRIEMNALSSAFTLNYGDSVPVRGEPCAITETDVKRAVYDGAQIRIPRGLTPDDIKRAVVAVYKAEAKRVISAKTAQFAEQMGVTVKSVRITSAKTRWGSCSSRGALCFSWYLMMAEENAIDYVIIHELAHRREHNHSGRFWAVVAEFAPDYKEHIAELKTLQDILSRQNWT